MAFKGDEYFRPDYDDLQAFSSSSDDEFTLIPCKRPSFDVWFNSHHEVLSDLHSQLCANGRHVFGNAFLQLGGFRAFAYHIFEYTLLLNHR